MVVWFGVVVLWFNCLSVVLIFDWIAVTWFAAGLCGFSVDCFVVSMWFCFACWWLSFDFMIVSYFNSVALLAIVYIVVCIYVDYLCFYFLWVRVLLCCLRVLLCLWFVWLRVLWLVLRMITCLNGVAGVVGATYLNLRYVRCLQCLGVVSVELWFCLFAAVWVFLFVCLLVVTYYTFDAACLMIVWCLVVLDWLIG